MRSVDEALQPFREPVVAPGELRFTLHALLDDDPVAVVRDNEAVQVEFETVLHRRAVDLRYKPAGPGQRGSVKPDPLAGGDELLRGLPRMAAASAANVDPKFSFQRPQPAFQRPDHARGNPRGVPVHPHHRAKGLEPKRMS